jgi:isopentenyl phosphate kinase
MIIVVMMKMKYLIFILFSAVIVSSPAYAITVSDTSSELPNVIFIKLGRSVVTNIDVPYSARLPIIQQFAEELAHVMKEKPHLKIIIGHGSGSFGRTAAKEQLYHEKKGFPSVIAAATVAKAALDLHTVIIAELVKAGVPAFSMPPSSTGIIDNESRRLISMDVLQIKRILQMGGVPVVFGDVIPCSDGRGAHIASTEEIFAFLGKHFDPSAIFLFGEVFLGEMEEIYQNFRSQSLQQGKNLSSIPEITPELWTVILSEVTNRQKTHETKEIIKKINLMIELVKKNPRTKVYVASGMRKGVLENLLIHNVQQPSGMLIQAGRKKSFH